VLSVSALIERAYALDQEGQVEQVVAWREVAELSQNPEHLAMLGRA
jgi:hypothetical protein